MGERDTHGKHGPLFGIRGIGLLPLTLLTLIWLVALSHYPRLPDILPSSFRFGGEPGSWSPKSIDFFVLPGTGFFVYLMLSLVNWLSSKRIIVRGRELRGRAAQQVQRAATRFLFLMKSSLLAFLLNVEFRSIQVAYGTRDGLGWDSYIAGALLLLYAAFGSFLLYRISRRWQIWQDAHDGVIAGDCPNCR